MVLIDKGQYIFRNYMCNSIHHKQFGSVLSAVNEVHRRILSKIDSRFFPVTMLIWYTLFHVKFWFPPGFWWKYIVAGVKNNSLHVGGKQIIPELILNQIMYVYPNINFMNKSCQFFRNIMCDATHNNYLGRD